MLRQMASVGGCPCWSLQKPDPTRGADERCDEILPVPAGGQGLFLLLLAGLVSCTKHLYFLLIKLSPGDTSVTACFAAFIGGEDGAVLLSLPLFTQSTSARQGYSGIKGRDWRGGLPAFAYKIANRNTNTRKM